MTERPPSPPEANALEAELRDQLDRIRDEDVPERLLQLARHLQELLRRHPQAGG